MISRNKIFGYYRENLIVETIEKYRCLSEKQLKLLFFNDVSNRQCQNVLRRISEEKKLINRWRGDIYEPYYYFIKDFAQKEHITLLNWLFIWYMVNSKYDCVKHFNYQKDYGILIPDLLLVTWNEFAQKEKTIFFEMDNSVNNEFDKIVKYNKLFEEYVEKYSITVDGFPIVYIATTNKSRLNKICKLIDSQNVNSLTFRPYLIWDLKEEILHANKTNFNKFIYGNNELYSGICNR